MHVAHMGQAGNTSKILLGKSDGKEQPEKLWDICGDIIKMGIFCKVMYWI